MVTTPKPMKPVKAWALVLPSGKVSRSLTNRPLMFATRKLAEKVQSNERIAHVEIREVAHAPKGH